MLLCVQGAGFFLWADSVIHYGVSRNLMVRSHNEAGYCSGDVSCVIVSDHWISGLSAESSDFRYSCPFYPVFSHDSLLTAFIAIFMIYTCFVSLEINDSQIFNYNNSCFFLILPLWFLIHDSAPTRNVIDFVLDPIEFLAPTWVILLQRCVNTSRYY